MAIGCFIDKTHLPTPEELQTALGVAFPFWERLLGFISVNYDMPPELSYGGKNYGWNLWYRKSGKALVSLYPQQDRFTAQVVLGKEQVEKAMGLELGEKVGKMLREMPQFHDGKWLFIPVASKQDVQDVEQLLLVKKRAARKK